MPTHRLAAALLLASLALPALAADAPTPLARPVVVELFTAQGCSSCPPADQLLSRMMKEPGLEGRLIALGYHVDYWNFGGWTDPFSTGDWTDRQKAYVKELAIRDAYTPQAIVDGRAVCVGSDERELRRLLAEAAALPAGRVDLALRRDGSKVVADVTAAPPAGGKGPYDVTLALVEDGLETAVKAGENAHRTLHDDFVVRRLQKLFKLRDAEARDTASVRLERGWKPGNMRLAVFLQDPATRAIVGAASAAIPE